MPRATHSVHQESHPWDGNDQSKSGPLKGLGLMATEDMTCHCIMKQQNIDDMLGVY